MVWFFRRMTRSAGTVRDGTSTGAFEIVDWTMDRGQALMQASLTAGALFPEQSGIQSPVVLW